MAETNPSIIVLDLDGTLWWPEMYMLWYRGGSPFQKNKTGNVIDRGGTEVYLLGDSREIIREMMQEPQWQNTKLAISSRTDEPSWAQDCLRLMEIVPGVSVKSRFAFEAISKSSKQHHFREIQRKSGVEFSDMIFFDNEQGNCVDVSRLGVHCVYTPDGLTRNLFEKGIRDWRKLRGFN